MTQEREADPNNPGWCIGCTPDECIGCGNGLTQAAPAAVPADERFSWFDFQQITDAPAVDEAIRALLEDHTDDNAACLVRAIVEEAGERLVRLSSAQAATPSEQAAPQPAQADDKWRKLALQFDGQRIAAMAHLRTLLAFPDTHAEVVRKFLAASPSEQAAPQPGAQSRKILGYLVEHKTDQHRWQFSVTLAGVYLDTALRVIPVYEPAAPSAQAEQAVCAYCYGSGLVDSADDGLDALIECPRCKPQAEQAASQPPVRGSGQ